jgi:transcriptional regulator with XRE-family HTH domain
LIALLCYSIGMGKRQTLAERVKSLRAKVGLTQQQLGHAAGLSMSIVAQIEQGAADNPSLNTLRALASSLGVELAELVRDVK